MNIPPTYALPKPSTNTRRSNSTPATERVDMMSAIDVVYQVNSESDSEQDEIIRLYQMVSAPQRPPKSRGTGELSSPTKPGAKITLLKRKQSNSFDQSSRRKTSLNDIGERKRNNSKKKATRKQKLSTFEQSQNETLLENSPSTPSKDRSPNNTMQTEGKNLETP